MSSITDALGTDIAHVNGDMQPTSGGDLQTISGIANLKAALFHRLVTVPGSLVHRPTYGCGVKLYQNAPSSFSKIQTLSAIIQEQFEQDPRVQSVNSVVFDFDDYNPQLTKIRVFVKPVGYSEQEMVFTPFAGGL